MGRRAINAIKSLRRAGAIYASLRPISIAIDYNVSDSSAEPAGSDGASDVTRIVLLLDMLSKKPLEGFGHFDGLKSDIEGVKKWAFMDGIGLVPKTQDKVLASFELYEILNVQTIADADGPVIHVLALAN